VTCLSIIRMNRDTPYSAAIFDLTTPVTIAKPDTKGRFQSIVKKCRLRYAIFETRAEAVAKKNLGPPTPNM